MIADWAGAQWVLNRAESLRRLALLGAVVVLSACVSQPTHLVDNYDFFAQGKLGIKAPQQQFSGNFSWRQTGVEVELQLWGPLGQGRTVLQGNPDHLVLRRGEEVVAQGVPEQVMEQHLGWSLPLSVVGAWLTGEPYTGFPVAQTCLATFCQLGWEIATSGAVAEGSPIPRRIKAEREGYRVTLVTRRYTENSSL